MANILKPNQVVVQSKPLETIEDFPNLESLVRPNAVAVVGASPNKAKSVGRIIPLLEQGNFKGDIYPVNPKYHEIDGHRTYARVSDIPGPVDLVVIMVPARAAVEAARDSAKKGVKFAVVMSSGFGEVGAQGRELQEELREIAHSSGMRIYGPNCPGMFMISDGLAISFSPRLAIDKWRPGRVALVSQGGAMGRAVLDAMEAHGTPGFNYWLSPGNEVDLNASDFLGWLAADPSTDMILLVLESFREGARFMAAANAARRAGKPVIVLKVGRSEAGVRATSTHTAALAGADLVADAAMQQAGIIRVDDIDELIDLARIVERYGVRGVRNVGICSLSGGSAALVADMCGVRGIAVDPPTGRTSDVMRNMLPELAAVGNPVDLTTGIFQSPELAGRALKEFISDENIDAVIFPYPYRLGRVNDVMAEQMVEVAKNTDKPIIAVGMSENIGNDSAERILRAARVPWITSASKATLAMERYMRLEKIQQRSEEPARLVDRSTRESRQRIEYLIQGKTGALSEELSEKILKEYKIPFSRGYVVDTEEESIRLAAEIGYPVVLKVAAEGIAHKSDLGFVHVNLRDADAVRTAYKSINESYCELTRGPPLGRVRVAEFVHDGLEVLCGLVNDPSFGPVVSFGLGGIYAEILADVTLRVCPITEVEASEMISRSRAYPILCGARGQQSYDIRALAALLSNLSHLGHDCADLIESIDINPVKVRTGGRGAIALDALVVRKTTSSESGKERSSVEN